jgi:hypothetical protein
MVVEIQVMAWEWHTNVAVLNWLMVYLHSLNNWISNDNTDINKQLKQCEDFLPLERDLTLSQK